MKTLALAAGAILLAGCAAAPSPAVTVTAPASTVTAPAPAPAPEPNNYASDGEQIRELLDSQGYPYYGPASDLEELATSVCEAIDNGISPELLVQVAMDNGFSMKEGAALVAASIVVVCPYNRDAV